MAYSELIKNFEKIRGYLRDFYVYGFKSRSEFGGKSARSYDNERRRAESWLGDAMTFRQDGSGKRVFLSVDSRRIAQNPLYRAFKAKSFTDRDVTLHFYILDILAGGRALTAGQIADEIAENYLSRFDAPLALDESTVRKKLREYEGLGILSSEKCGRSLLYRRTDGLEADLPGLRDAIAFFSGDLPVGVVGSYLLDRLPPFESFFRFKHNYILYALDSEVTCSLLEAITGRRAVELTLFSPRRGREYTRALCPLRLYVSTQTGRQYILGYHYQGRRMAFQRLDMVKAVKVLTEEKQYAKYEEYYSGFRENLWGVSTGEEPELHRVEMVVHVGPDEGYIAERLRREKRCGTVERAGPESWRFTAEVYDASELLPWLRTFIGRIESLTCSDRAALETFREDLQQMREMYGGGEDGIF